MLLDSTSYIPVQLALIKKSRSVGQGNRQGTEVGRAREKAGHRNRQGKEVGRARKKAGHGNNQGKEIGRAQK